MKLSLGGGRACAVEIAYGQQDLCRWTQDTGTSDGLIGFGEQAAKLRHGHIQAALREPQQRQAGLRLAPIDICTFVIVFGKREFPTQAV